MRYLSSSFWREHLLGAVFGGLVIGVGTHLFGMDGGFLFYFLQGFVLSLVLSLYNAAALKRLMKRIELPLEKDERIELESPASLDTPGYSVFGKLVLTNSRLLFQPPEVGGRYQPEQVSRDLVASAEAGSTSIVRNRFLLIGMRDGTWRKYKVKNATAWVEKLNDRRGE